MSACIFCNIAQNESPATVEYKDDLITIFRDIYPKAPFHLLVIPNIHIRSLNDCTEEHGPLLAHIFAKIQEVTKMLGIAQDGYKVICNTEKGGGQLVFHLHFHILSGVGEGALSEE